MRFSINREIAGRVNGWILPDDPSHEPAVRVFVDGQFAMRLEPSIMLQRPVDEGKHHTGRLGFELNRTLLPILDDGVGIEVFDEATGMLVYRRLAADQAIAVEEPLFLLQTGWLDRLGAQRALGAHFMLAYPAVEQWSEETLHWLFRIRQTRSFFLSGRIPYWRVVKNLAHTKLRSAALLADPFEEVAARMHYVRTADDGGARDVATLPMPMRDAAQALATIDLTDASALDRWFQSDAVVGTAFFNNPLVRLLTCSPQHDVPEEDDVGRAFDLLADMECVTVEAEPERTREIWEGLFGAEPIAFSDKRPLAVLDLADRLRELHSARTALEYDRRLYDEVRDAVANAVIAAA